jgi:phosphoenolpyruvate carboxylase
MRPIKVIATVLSLSLLAAPAFAEGAHDGKSPAAQKANKDKAARREARILEALKKEGISEAKAKRVVSVVKKHETELREVRKGVRTSRQALKKNPNDANAKQALEASRAKMKDIRARMEKEISQFLTQAEQAKVKKLVGKAIKHRRGQKNKKAS